MAKRILALLLCCCMALSLAACESHTDAPAAQGPADVAAATTPPQAPTESNAPASADPYAPAEAGAAVESPAPSTPIGYKEDGGPIFIEYVDRQNVSKGFKLLQLDLDTKQFVELFKFNYTNKPWTCTIQRTPYEDFPLVGMLYGQMFNHDFSKMAVNWRDKSDNSYHVGWIDRDGNETDVTPVLAGDMSGFEKRPEYVGALFTPDGYFFCRENGWGIDMLTYYKIDPETMEIVETGEIQYTQGLVFNPDGSFCKIYDWHPAGSGITHYLKNDAITNDLYLVNEFDGLRDSNDVWLTPKTDYHITYACYSALHNKIAFAAFRGEEYALFTLDYTGKEEMPEKVMDLSDKDWAIFKPIIWRD